MAKDSVLVQVMNMQADIIDGLSAEQLDEMHKEITKTILDRVDLYSLDNEARKAIILLAHDHQLYEGLLIRALKKHK